MRASVGGRVAVWAALVVATAGVSRAVVALPEGCDTPSPAAVENAAEEAIGWLAHNQRPDGRWLYRYDIDDGRDVGGYNWVRHAGVLFALEQASAAGMTEAGPVADRGIEAARGRLVVHDDRAALVDAGQLTTGGTSL